MMCMGTKYSIVISMPFSRRIEGPLQAAVASLRIAAAHAAVVGKCFVKLTAGGDCGCDGVAEAIKKLFRQRNFIKKLK